ncbi:hypothetical protein DFH06DRAFT_168121 [Mycena polygramma]|nr:hypothetical protein DFH06DRAFT_168121 [Mycena polygramma]
MMDTKSRISAIPRTPVLRPIIIGDGGHNVAEPAMETAAVRARCSLCRCARMSSGRRWLDAIRVRYQWMPICRWRLARRCTKLQTLTGLSAFFGALPSVAVLPTTTEEQLYITGLSVDRTPGVVGGWDGTGLKSNTYTTAWSRARPPPAPHYRQPSHPPARQPPRPHD